MLCKMLILCKINSWQTIKLIFLPPLCRPCSVACESYQKVTTNVLLWWRIALVLLQWIVGLNCAENKSQRFISCVLFVCECCRGMMLWGQSFLCVCVWIAVRTFCNMALPAHLCVYLNVGQSWCDVSPASSGRRGFGPQERSYTHASWMWVNLREQTGGMKLDF